ncbi:MAG: Flp pilus assembly complex ATPase component TadA [Propionibacteriaceae bacterium]|nr:Flp pilus assembly complex ATPase component TadA [Propionibacteriaceae bacterium]
MNLSDRVLAVQKGERGIPRDPNSPRVSSTPTRAFEPGSPAVGGAAGDNAPPAPWLPVPESAQQPAAAPSVTWAAPAPNGTDDHRLASRAPAPPVVVETHDALSRIKEDAVEQLFERMGSRLSDPNLDEAALQSLVQQELNAIIEGGKLPLTARERQRLIREVHDDVLGLGPLQPLIDDKAVTEVMVNGPYKVYVERAGKLTLSQVRFKDEPHLRRVIERIVSRVGRRIDESSPLVDARLDDGSRVNAIIPPLAVSGSTLTIRKFSKDALTVPDLINLQTLTPEIAELLNACVVARLNIIVSGGTGTGKTTLLNILSGFIPSTERIVSIEDAVELQLQQDHVVRLESRPANVEGKGEVTIRDLVKNSLRMRPDRIIVGEVRGGEALDMLQAMNTGHDGSLSTVHANNPRDALARLETLVLMSGMDLPLRAIREQVCSAIDVIVQLTRLRDGTRRVTALTEVHGMEGQTITMQDVFEFDYSAGVSPDGKFLGKIQPTGVRPAFTQKFSDLGIRLSPGVFGSGAIWTGGHR